MLSVKNLTFSYINSETGQPEAPVLRDFSLELAQGEAVAVMGESGSGKTTLTRLLLGLEKPVSGTIQGLEGKRVAAVFQEDRLLPWLTAKGNVALCAGEEEAERWLSAFGLREELDAYPAALSGGMCRRVALARAVAAAPDLLLLDEAFKGIDPARKDEIMTLLKETFRDKLILFTSHDDAEVAAFATRIMEL